jgi:hypothetical protein
MKFILKFCILMFSSHVLASHHGEWDKILKSHVSPSGKVDYKKIPVKQLDKYLDYVRVVEEKNYKKWDANKRKAFLINAYNAFTVKLVLENYPLKSIKDIGTLLTNTWKQEYKFLSLFQGKIKTLDAIEHDTLRKDFKDYRIHAAVNCASVSCPKLRNEAYVGSKLDLQLDDAMRMWLADKGRNHFSKEEARISKIFDWYSSDFEKWGGGIHKVLLQYGPPEAREAFKYGTPSIKYMKYDWNLNDI